MYRHDWHERMKKLISRLSVYMSYQRDAFNFCLPNIDKGKISVVVNFLSQVIFVFVLFCGMVMHANEVETITSDKKLTKTYPCTKSLACVTDETKLTAIEAALLVHSLAQI